ncbi:MAG: hypothetical protein ACXVQ3_03740 [Gaiellaceae bacterium]
MLFFEIHPVAPAATPGGSIAGWVVLCVVLAVVVASGVFLTSRR